jgi:hypothetical protein
MTSIPATPDEQLRALNARMNTLEAAQARLTTLAERLDTLLAGQLRGPRGPRGAPGEPGRPGEDGSIAGLSLQLETHLQTLDEREAALFARSENRMNELEARAQRAITSVNLLTPKAVQP